MLRRSDFWMLAIALLLALAASVVAYLYITLPGPEPAPPATNLATARNLAAATPTLAPTETPAPTPTPTITPSPVPAPEFGPVTFGTGVRGAEVLNPGTTFAAGTGEVYALWSYRYLVDGTPYHWSWFLNDAPWAESPAEPLAGPPAESLAWDGEQHGSDGAAYITHIGQHDAGGLPPGNYRLEVFIGERQVQVATFVVQGPTPTPPPTPTPQPDLQTAGRRSARSMVQVLIPDGAGNASSGSGSIVDGQRGLILTTWHILTDDETGELLNEDGDAQIWLAVDPDQPPDAAYWAQILPGFSDEEEDLAILQITHHLAGETRTPVEGALDLPAVPLGDSSRVRRGDHVLLLGYPDYAGHTLSWTEGIVATRDREWIKVDATVSHGHSGGMLLDGGGNLTGVLIGSEQIAIDRTLAVARPIQAAIPLIEGAMAAREVPPLRPPFDAESTGQPLVLLGSPALELRDGPSAGSQVLSEVPSGTAVNVLGAPEWDGERFWYHVAVEGGDEAGWTSETHLVPAEVAGSPILFTSSRAGSDDVYRIYPDGSGLLRLTDDAADEGQPSWLPGGSYVVFSSNSGGDADLYVLDPAGGPWHQLTSGEGDDVQPACSPDGTRIAFASDRDGDLEIYVVDGDGNVEQITHNGAWDGFPAWSPDSNKLVFASERTGNSDLFLVDLRTGVETQLTTSPYSDAHPSWSPQGDEIVYTMVVAEGDTLLPEIGVLDLHDPAPPRRLTVSGLAGADNRHPDWSPDGRWIVFTAGRDGEAGLYLVPAQGGPPTKLTGSPTSGDTMPAWTR